VSEAIKAMEERTERLRAGELSPPVPQWFIELFLRPTLHALSRLLWRIELRGVENIPREGGYILAANHQTYADPFWVSIPIRREVRYLAWNQIFKWPVVGMLAEWFGAWPLAVERGNPTAYRRSLQWLRAGGVLVIFPEGARACADGSPSRFKTGAVRLALEAGVPILPVTIRGGNRVWPRGQRLPRLARVRIVYHPLRRPAPLLGEDARQCAQRETDALAQIISSEL
jgi:1-acyl-sn-glycerol-3-phosphate acyltransferase